MQDWVYIFGLMFVATGVALVTGCWRWVFSVFRIAPRRMTVERCKLHVSAPETVDRVNTILKSFAGGFNRMITARSYKACWGYCDSLPVLYRPFAHEGMAMGYTLRHLFRYDAANFEERVVKPRPEFRYLYYVGLGFWSGMRNHSPGRLARIVDGLDPLHGYLCYDGYGFKTAFFDYRNDANSLRRLDRLDGYATHAAYQGVGRAFFFLYMDQPDLWAEHVEKLGAYAKDAAAGAGLAAVFVHPDRLERARTFAMRLPAVWRPHYHLGMCFGLKARSINDLDQFERDMARLEPRMREAVHASIRECDRIELLVRSEQGENGYETWRNRVTNWMASRIEYPLASVRVPRRPALNPELRTLDRAKIQYEARPSPDADMDRKVQREKGYIRHSNQTEPRA